MAKNVAGDLLAQNYELQKKFNEFFRQINQGGGYPFAFGKLMVHLQGAVQGRFLDVIAEKHYPQFSKKRVNGGYVLEVLSEGTSYETILSIETAGGTKYSINDKVIANRDITQDVKEGSKGVIVRILEPHLNGHSNDIIMVRFQNNGKIIKLKSKEIDLN
jgi:hypothetical protein